MEYSNCITVHHVFLSNCVAEVMRVCFLKALLSLMAASDPKTRSVSGIWQCTCGSRVPYDVQVKRYKGCCGFAGRS